MTTANHPLQRYEICEWALTIDPPYYDVAVKCLNDYFEPLRRKTFERHLFHQITQNSGERFTDFVMRLRKQIARCNYDPSVIEELIADRITQGCISEILAKHQTIIGICSSDCRKQSQSDINEPVK